MNKGIYLALGSNVGNREENLKRAIERISEIKTTQVINKSKIYETKPVGYLKQSDFLNMVIEIETCLKPQELLCELQKIEMIMDRKHEIHWGPRTIDIDILLYDDLNIYEHNLIIPHERIAERAFVLIPLKDIYCGNEINGKNINGLIEKCSDKDGIKVYKDRIWYKFEVKKWLLRISSCLTMKLKL